MNSTNIAMADQLWDTYGGEIPLGHFTSFMAAAILRGGMTIERFYQLASDERAMRQFILTANSDGKLKLSGTGEEVCGPYSREERFKVFADLERKKEIAWATRELSRPYYEVMPDFFRALFFSHITWGEGPLGVLLQNVTENDGLLRAMAALTNRDATFSHNRDLNYGKGNMGPVQGVVDSDVYITPRLQRHFTYEEIVAEAGCEIGRCNLQTIRCLKEKLPRKESYYFLAGNCVVLFYVDKDWKTSVVPLEGFVFRKGWSIVSGVSG
jgi:hypothetical protein